MFDMNGLIDANPESCASTSLSTLSLSKGRTEEPNDLKLVEILIDKIIKRLEENSFEPKVQDALKAIQLKQRLSEAKSGELVKTSEAEKTFWQTIDEIRTSELESRTENIQAQILKNHSPAQI